MKRNLHLLIIDPQNDFCDLPPAYLPPSAGAEAPVDTLLDEVYAALVSIPGVVCPRPQGAFYAFPDISCAFGKSHAGHAIKDDVGFCSALLEAKGVACVPGSAFGEPRAVRISYTCKPAELTEGLRRFREFFAEIE